jgi:hypothetical protein
MHPELQDRIDTGKFLYLLITRLGIGNTLLICGYRIILSDGQYFIQAMLATQENHHVENKTLDKNVLLKLTSFVTNAVQGRKYVTSPSTPQLTLTPILQ